MTVPRISNDHSGRKSSNLEAHEDGSVHNDHDKEKPHGTASPEGKIPSFNHEKQKMHKRYLNLLKEEFLKLYKNPIEYEKSPDEFDVIKTIGAGAFGTVFLVRDTISFYYYAMKTMEKSAIVQKKVVRQIIREKKVLQALSFPFVVPLEFTSKDNGYVYFVVPFEAGGELYTLIKNTGALPEAWSQFYAAQMVLALEYLHHCCVVHRDVKPENILINASGYIKLVDFGFCKIIKTRTWTLCGTPEYIAPEIIMGKGYSYTVDWWSLGVLIFEMSTGYPPFYGANRAKLYDKILIGKFKTPETMSKITKSIIRHFLEVDPTKRYGSLKTGGYDIKSHAWFHETNWDGILHQKDIPPYIPVCKDLADTTNFTSRSEAKLKSYAQPVFEDEFADF